MNSLPDTVRLFALVAIATADVVAVSWTDKFDYHAWRPADAIRATGANVDGNPSTVEDPTWQPRAGVGNFGGTPEHTSGSASFAGAASKVLQAFAPDGEQVAFAWSGEKYDNSDIYVTLVGSLDVRRLTTDPGEDYAPSWSPDGRRIAFLRKHGSAARIQVISALGGPDAKVSDFPVGATMPPGHIGSHVTWSPDGRSVVAGRDPRSASEAPAGIHVIPLDGGEPRAITRPRPPTFDFSPSFSPDGGRLAYTSCDPSAEFLPLLLPVNCAVRVVDIDRTWRRRALRER